MTNPFTEDVASENRRPAWRQRLVEAEGGFRAGIRADSTLFAFFFCAAGVILASLVSGLSRVEWAVLILSLGFALSAELLHQVLKQIATESREHLEGAILLGTSAAMVAHITAASVAACLILPHFISLWR